MTEWRAIVGYEGLYEVSDHGAVRSLDRVVVSGTHLCPYRGKTLRLMWNGQHFQADLSRNGESSFPYVHALVLEAFVCARPKGACALHRDDDSHNNHVSNLYWGTMQDNAFDRVRNGNDANARRTHCKRGHLLGLPNVKRSEALKGKRSCLACNQAKSLAGYYNRMHDEEHVQSLSDEKYAKIMAGAV